MKLRLISQITRQKNSVVRGTREHELSRFCVSKQPEKLLSKQTDWWPYLPADWVGHASNYWLSWIKSIIMAIYNPPTNLLCAVLGSPSVNSTKCSHPHTQTKFRLLFTSVFTVHNCLMTTHEPVVSTQCVRWTCSRSLHCNPCHSKGLHPSICMASARRLILLHLGCDSDCLRRPIFANRGWGLSFSDSAFSASGPRCCLSQDWLTQ